MSKPLYGSGLDDVLDTVAEIDDPDIQLLVTGFRNIAHRARTGRLDLETTKLLLATIAASPDGTDLIGACGLTVDELTDSNPALDQLTDISRKTAIQAGQKAASRLSDDYLRRPASEACAALDHLDPERRGQAVTDEQKKELSKKVAEANKKSINRPR